MNQNIMESKPTAKQRSSPDAQNGKKLLTERVDNTFLLWLDVLEATDPLSPISHGADSSGPVWALESRNEEVPYS